MAEENDRKIVEIGELNRKDLIYVLSYLYTKTQALALERESYLSKKLKNLDSYKQAKSEFEAKLSKFKRDAEAINTYKSIEDGSTPLVEYSHEVEQSGDDTLSWVDLTEEKTNCRDDEFEYGDKIVSSLWNDTWNNSPTVINGIDKVASSDLRNYLEDKSLKQQIVFNRGKENFQNNVSQLSSKAAGMNRKKGRFEKHLNSLHQSKDCLNSMIQKINNGDYNENDLKKQITETENITSIDYEDVLSSGAYSTILNKAQKAKSEKSIERYNPVMCILQSPFISGQKLIGWVNLALFICILLSFMLVAKFVGMGLISLKFVFFHNFLFWLLMLLLIVSLLLNNIKCKEGYLLRKGTLSPKELAEIFQKAYIDIAENKITLIDNNVEQTKRVINSYDKKIKQYKNSAYWESVVKEYDQSWEKFKKLMIELYAQSLGFINNIEKYSSNVNNFGNKERTICHNYPGVQNPEMLFEFIPYSDRQFDIKYDATLYLVPKNFRNLKDIGKMIVCLVDHRADNFKEVANLCRSIQHDEAVERSLNKINENLHSIDESIKDSVDLMMERISTSSQQITNLLQKSIYSQERQTKMLSEKADNINSAIADNTRTVTKELGEIKDIGMESSEKLDVIGENTSKIYGELGVLNAMSIDTSRKLDKLGTTIRGDKNKPVYVKFSTRRDY